MSISEEVHPPGGGPDPSGESPAQGGPPDARPRPPRQQAGDFERTPPQDVAAEQCVLGGMLLSKDAIADVVEILRTNDFYQPKHGIVFDAILDLYGRGEPADLITVASALVDSGDHNRVGGATYLHTLIASVPTAANAAYYARIVADRAVLRRLIEAGTRVTQLGYGAAAGGGRDIDDVVDMAQQAVYDVTERRVSEDFAALNELLQPTLDEIEAIGANGGVMTGVPTGFSDLDRLLNGLHPGQLIIVAGRPGLGKALALDTPLPTPTGWTTMGAVRPGDLLVGADGTPTRVVAATDVMHDRPCYEVEFSDGTVIVADAQHQWRTTSRSRQRIEVLVGAIGPTGSDPARRPARAGIVAGDATADPGTGPGSVVTTEQIAATLYDPDGLPNHAVQGCMRPGPDNTRGAGTRHIVDARPVRSVPVRCVQVDSADHMYMAGESWIPTHNSTVAMDFARSCSIRNSMSSVIFSLEMSKVEIVMRLLSAEARVPLHTLRSGQLSDDDWTKLARRMGEISEAPLFCDDTPNMNLMEIRAKARRLKQRHDIKLIVVDYLQLMSGPKRAESRQQEVAELSRGLKLLAKEVECPLIAVSQLNRGPEQRTDKRPQLSDLRESGCLTANTRILRADTGAETTIGELLASGATDVPVWSADEKLRYTAMPMTHAFSSGMKEAFTLRLASGRTVEATANHPFLTIDGWKPLGELSDGSRIASPRHVPAPLVTVEWPESEVVMLAHLLGDGSFVRRQPIRYASVDEQNLTAVTEAATHFGITAVRDEYAAARCTSLRLPAPFRLARGRRNPIAAWLDRLGLFGLRSPEKFIPAGVFSLPKRQIATFIHHLWATNGSVSWDAEYGQARISYASTSRKLIDQLALLFLRFGIQTHIKTVRKTGYQLAISGEDDQLRFLREIGVHGSRSNQAATCLSEIVDRKRNANRDTVPKEVWTRVRTTLAVQGTTHREFAAATNIQFCGSTRWKHSPSRSWLAQVATVLGDAGLEMHATNDMYWDEVVSIESIGEQPVYDATVLGTHNFIANGVAVHNSIEQDADVVLLLHREDYYDKESPRAGEADFIVAKHRNGPTDTITVAAQLHLSRFVDMAIS